MDFVDEQDVVRLQIGQKRGEIAGALDHRPRGGAEPDPELARDDLRQGRLAEPGRAEKQHMVERLAPALRRRDEDAQIVAQLALADEFVEDERPNRGLGRVLLVLFGGDHPRRGLAHRVAPWPRPLFAPWPSSCNPARISASSAAPSPSRRAAAATAPNASARR